MIRQKASSSLFLTFFFLSSSPSIISLVLPPLFIRQEQKTICATGQTEDSRVQAGAHPYPHKQKLHRPRLPACLPSNTATNKDVQNRGPKAKTKQRRGRGEGERGCES
mmetsp:Transcript_30450/g.59842  ORF Transcript_30450/g.59842 Transcript_30450/m.59842 type:complete len:108 (+) Transcript_30450:507-830(+)